MKKIHILLTTVAILFLLSSCSDEYDEPTLTLSKTAIQFDSPGGNDEIKIETNKDEWDCWSEAEGQWITLKPSNNSLKITATANNGEERTAVVIVNALGKTSKVIIKQAAGTQSDLKVMIDELLVKSEGKTIRIDFLTNEKQLTIASEAEWIKANYKEGFNFITLDIEVNKTFEPREAEVILTAGKKQHIIKIVQEGRDIYLFPLLSESSSFAEIMDYEKARGNHFVQVMYYPLYGYVFTSPNRNFPLFYYDLEDMLVPHYKKVTVVCDDTSLLKAAEFENRLADFGFNVNDAVKDESTWRYEGKQGLPFKLTITFVKNKAEMVYDYIEEQPQAYPSFEELPWQNVIENKWLSFLDKEIHGAKLQVAIDYEEGLGNKKNPLSEESFALFDMTDENKGKYDNVGHAYWAIHPTKENGLADDSPFIGDIEAFRSIFQNINLAVYEKKTNYFKLTKEFKDFMEANDFFFYGELKPNLSFVFNRDDLFVVVTPTNFQNYSEGLMLDTQLMYIDMSKPVARKFVTEQVDGINCKYIVDPVMEYLKKITK